MSFHFLDNCLKWVCNAFPAGRCLFIVSHFCVFDSLSIPLLYIAGEPCILLMGGVWLRWQHAGTRTRKILTHIHTYARTHTQNNNVREKVNNPRKHINQLATTICIQATPCSPPIGCYKI